MSNSSYAFNLIVASQIFFSYCTYINFGLGLFGNLLNTLFFTNLKIFRHNRCAFYLIVESIVDIAQLTQIFANEIWKLSMNGMDPMSDFPVWCKLRYILVQWLRLILASIVCFAAIDQFLSTNHVAYLRQLSSLKLARCQICIATLLCLLHTVPSAAFAESRPSSGCIIINTGLINYYSFFFYPVLNGLLPIFVSSMFSILAYRNVRRIIRRQIPINRRRLDQQLTAMVFVRVIFFVLLQLPFTIYRIGTLRLTIIQANTLEYAVKWISCHFRVVFVLSFGLLDDLIIEVLFFCILVPFIFIHCRLRLVCFDFCSPHPTYCLFTSCIVSLFFLGEVNYAY
jgi:hypothetical protein